MMEQNKNKKKILILLMSCNIEFFQKEEELCKQTWLSNIDQYDNIDYFIYTASGNDKCYISTNNHKIKVPTNDDLYSTLSKTLLTLQVLEQIQILQNYDYIFRTNLSTYVNISLLNEFVQNITDDNITYATECYITKEQGPYKYCIFPQGNGTLLSRKLYKQLTFNNFYRYMEMYKDIYKPDVTASIDDNGMGFILTCYYLENKFDIFDMFQEFGFVRPEYLHEPDPYYDNINDFNKCIAISYRVFKNRTLQNESDNCMYIHRNIKYDNTDLSFINKWLQKDMIHLVVTYLIDDIITKQDALNILKYNKDFRNIPYIKYER